MLLLELFPTPVAIFDLKPLSDEERSTIMKTPTGNIPSSYLEVVSSNDQYILRNKKLKRLQKDIQGCVDDYKNEIMSCDQELYITNSWVNFLLPQIKFPIHHHSNSLVSGVQLRARGGRLGPPRWSPRREPPLMGTKSKSNLRISDASLRIFSES